MTRKKIIKTVLSILLLTSFYTAKSMLFSPTSLVTPFSKIITIGSKFLSEKYQYLLKKYKLFGCNSMTTHEYIKKLIEYGYIEDAKNIINTARRDFIIENGSAHPTDNITPLTWAVKEKNLELIELCLKYCTKDTISKALDKALDLTINLDMIKLLLQYCSEDIISNALNKTLDKDSYMIDFDLTKLLLQYCSKDTINQSKPKLCKLYSKLCHKMLPELNGKLKILKTELDGIESNKESLENDIENNNHTINNAIEKYHDLEKLLLEDIRPSDKAGDQIKITRSKLKDDEKKIQILKNEGESLIRDSELLRQKFVDLSRKIKNITETITAHEDEIKKQLCLE